MTRLEVACSVGCEAGWLGRIAMGSLEHCAGWVYWGVSSGSISSFRGLVDSCKYVNSKLASMDLSESCEGDFDFWPEDDLAAKFCYVRIPQVKVEEDHEVLARMERHVSLSKLKLKDLKDETIEKEAQDCTFSPRLHSPKRNLKVFLKDQSQFLREKELHLQALRRNHRDRTKEVWPYQPTINSLSAKMASKKCQSPLIQRLCKPPLKLRHIATQSNRTQIYKATAKTNMILTAQLEKELNVAWEAHGCDETLDYRKLGHVLLDLNFLKQQNNSLHMQIWDRLSQTTVTKAAVLQFLVKESRLSSQKPTFDSLYYNRSLSASHSRTRADTESSAATSCDVRINTHE